MVARFIYEYEPGLVETLPGYRLASQILDNNIPEVSAIIAGSDILVAGVLQALYERRLLVPDDISLIGCDDSMTRFLSPPLSSIGQPLRCYRSSRDRTRRSSTTAACWRGEPNKKC